MSAPNIFISIGRPLCDTQREFKRALMQAVRARGFEPRSVGKLSDENTDTAHARPIEQVRRILKECDGTIVVGYEKHQANELVTDSLAPVSRKLSDVRLSTAWNQAEAAMAYASEMPMFLICERGVLGECILQDGVVGSIANVTISKEAVFDDDFQSMMSSWAKDVLDTRAGRLKARADAELLAEANRERRFKPDEFSIHELASLLGALSWKSALLLTTGALGLLGVAFSVGVFAVHHGWVK